MGETDLAPPDATVVEPDEVDHVEEWKQETDGIDRVISIALSIDTPRTADQIADEAHVSQSTARKHLERLVDLHILSAVEQRGAKTYYPDDAYQRFREVSQLIEEYDRDEIESITISAQEEIEDLVEEYGVESPDDLRKAATAEETSSTEAREYFKLASQWDQHLHMLSIAREALDRYGEFSEHGNGEMHASA